MKRPILRKLKWAPIFAIVLSCYTVFALLDAFVIPKDVVALEASGTTEAGAGTRDSASGQSGSGSSKHSGGEGSGEAGHKKPSGKPGHGRHKGSRAASGTEDKSTSEASGGSAGSTSGGGSAVLTTEGEAKTVADYSENGVTITLSEQVIQDTVVHIADVTIEESASLRSGLASNSFGRNLKETTSEMAEANGAILAINGDYYGFRDTGYVLRNGQLYRDTPSGGEDLVVYQDGTMEIISESEVTAEELVNRGAVQIYSFGPGLVSDGKITVSEGEEVGQSMQSNPRSAIGQIGEGHYVFVVSDGRTEESAGLSLSELAAVMKNLGCVTAYNLDGGGSSTLWFNGEIINNPTGGRAGHGNSERSVSDIVYIAK